MARKRMITRTILSTEATIMTVDTVSAEVGNITVLLSGTFKDEAACLKAAKKAAETDTLKVVAVVDTAIKEDLWGMPEEDFMKYAQKLPPRGATETETEPETES